MLYPAWQDLPGTRHEGSVGHRSPLPALHFIALRHRREEPRLQASPLVVETDPEDSAIELIKSMLPSGVLVEQVEGLSRLGLASGKIPMEEFSEMVLNIRDVEGKLFYKAGRTFKLNASIWLGINRPRFIAGLNTPQV